MKISKSSNLFNSLNKSQVESGKIIPYIDKFLRIHPYTGGYHVEDSIYVSDEKRVKYKNFHPSGDCLKCPRLLFWERDPAHYKKLEDEITPNLQRIFKTGSALHAMYQAWFEAMGKIEGFPDFIGNEVRINNTQWKIGGYIDSVVRFPNDEKPTVLELKTTNDRSFSLLKEPYPPHKMQVACYMMELDTPNSIILYINKNTGDLKEFRVEPIDMMPVLRKWSSVRIALETMDVTKLDCGCRAGDSTWEKCPAKAFCKRYV